MKEYRVRVPPSLMAEVDAICGGQSRAQWIERAIASRLAVEKQSALRCALCDRGTHEVLALIPASNGAVCVACVDALVEVAFSLMNPASSAIQRVVSSAIKMQRQELGRAA